MPSPPSSSSRLHIESKVRQLIGSQMGTSLTKTKLRVGIGGDGRERMHEFDGVSPDRRIVIEVKTNQLKATDEYPDGRYFSAIKWALIGDLYMLGRVEAEIKLLVLTDRPLFDLSVVDLDGILPENTRVVYCQVVE